MSTALTRRTVLNGLFVAMAGCTVARPLRLSGVDPLPSWNDGPVKAAILGFVARVTTTGGPDFVRVEERIATFDTTALSGWRNRCRRKPISPWRG